MRRGLVIALGLLTAATAGADPAPWLHVIRHSVAGIVATSPEVTLERFAEAATPEELEQGGLDDGVFLRPGRGAAVTAGYLLVRLVTTARLTSFPAHATRTAPRRHLRPCLSPERRWEVP